jgi:hypothetical protein
MAALLQDRLADAIVGGNITLTLTVQLHPCGGGFEYLHRDSASRRKRQKGKSQIWKSKIWSRGPRDSDPRKTTLARTNGVYKRQNRPLVREDATEKQERNCQKVINIWSWAPDGTRHQDLLNDWLSVAMWLWLWQFSYIVQCNWVESSWVESQQFWDSRQPVRTLAPKQKTLLNPLPGNSRTHREWKDLVRAVVNCRMCKLAISL